MTVASDLFGAGLPSRLRGDARFARGMTPESETEAFQNAWWHLKGGGQGR